MENLSISDWGIAVAATLYVVQMFLNWTQKFFQWRNGNGKGSKGGIDCEDVMVELNRIRTEYLRPMRDQTQDLFEWHNVNDSEGYKLWYVRPSLAEAIASLADNISMQTQILRDIARITKETLDEVRHN